MKKMYVFILAFLLAASMLCGCGSTEAEDTTVPSIMLSTEPVATTAATTAPTEETVPTETTISQETTEPSTEPTTAETKPTETTAQHTHSYSSTVAAPTCTTDGYTLHKCKTCGYSYTSNTSTAYGHTFVYEVHDATTTECGYVLHICRDCDYSYKDNYTDKLPIEHTHSYVATVTAPTCMQYGEGYTTYTCETCGHSYKDNYTPQLEHTMVETGPKEATCITYGVHMTYHCSKCGFANFDYITDEPAGHSWSEWVITTPATAESDGIETRTCEICGATETQILTQLVDIHTHSYTAEVTAPTCTEGGYTTYTCVCGEYYTDTETSATGHSWNEWTRTKEPTTSETGIDTRTCSVCKNSETRSVDKLPAEEENSGSNTTDTSGSYAVSEVVDLINQYRTEAGLPALSYYSAGQEAANIRAAELNVSFSHTRPDGSDYTDLSGQYNLWGECIANGYGGNAQAVVDAWIASGIHRDTLMATFFSCAVVARNGANWVILLG